MFTEEDNSPQEDFTIEGFRATRNFRGEWEARFDFLDEIIREPYPFNDNAWVSSIKFSPIGCVEKNEAMNVAIEVNTFEFVRATVEYSTNPLNQVAGGNDSGRNKRQDNGDGTYFTYQADGEMELFTMSATGMAKQWWGATSLEVRDPDNGLFTAVQKPIIRHQVTWHQVKNAPWGTFIQICGCVNDRVFVVPVSGARCEPTTVLFSNYTSGIEVSYDNAGEPSVDWKIDMLFLQRRIISPGKIYCSVHEIPQFSMDLRNSGSFTNATTGNGVGGWLHGFRDNPGNTGWDIIAIRDSSVESHELAYPYANFNLLSVQQ